MRVSPWDGGSIFSDWEEAANPLGGTVTSEFSFIEAEVENYQQKSYILDQAVQNTNVGMGVECKQGDPGGRGGALYKKSDFPHTHTEN